MEKDDKNNEISAKKLVDFSTVYLRSAGSQGRQSICFRCHKFNITLDQMIE